MKKAPSSSPRTPAKAKAKPKIKSTSSTRAPRKPSAKATQSASAGSTPKTRATASAAKTRAKSESTASEASRNIDKRIAELAGWRGETLARMRALILEADPQISEEWKWENPVWSHHGIVCTGEAYKKAVKLTFAKGAGVPDPSRLFNSSLEGNTRRAIDIPEGVKLDAGAFKTLIRAAVALNASLKQKP